MLFKILSRSEAEDYQNIKYPHIWISISDVYDTNANIKENEYCRGVLYLKFDDVEDEFASMNGTPFSEKMAQSILNFVHKHKNEVDLIYVNCFAGVSRSSAVAFSLNRWLNGENNKAFISCDRKYNPNELVMEIMERFLPNKKKDRNG